MQDQKISFATLMFLTTTLIASFTLSASFASAKRAAQLIHNELAGDSKGSGKRVVSQA